MMAQRRPSLSDTAPQKALDKNTTIFAQNKGMEIISGVQPSSFCRYVPNSAQIE